MQRLMQLAFDFLEDAGVVAKPVPPRPPQPKPPQPKPSQPSQPAKPRGPLDLGERLTSVAPQAVYRHPAATREVVLTDTLVGYAFRRGKRRTIGFSVGADGLTVSAPKWVPLYEVDAALREKAGWILKKLAQSQERQQRMAQAQIEWKDGASFPYLGGTVALRLDPSHAFGGVGGELVSTVDAVTGGTQQTLHMALPSQATPDQIRDATQAWLMRQAKALFTERLNHFAPLLGVQWRKLSLSSAGTRWGSAKADGSIRLHWRLVHFKPSVIDYVVAHELSHLRVMDHSPRFWDTVATLLPDYATLRGELKEEAIPKW